jgi:hypothetical protein
MPLTVDERLQYERLVAEAVRRATSRFSTFFAESGPLARQGYLKHLDFFAAGKKFKERLFMAANRVGKSRREPTNSPATSRACTRHGGKADGFEQPVECWAVGTNSQTTRDIVQAKLLGSVQMPGTGMIPGHLISSTISSRGLPGALEGAVIKTRVWRQQPLGPEDLRTGAAVV